MTSTLKRALCVFLTACMLLIFIPQPKANAQPASGEITTGMGYTLLKTDAQRKLYMEMAEALVNCRAFSPAVDTATISSEELNHTRLMVNSDFPECFWGEASYNHNTPKGMTYAIGHSISAYSQELLDAQMAFNQKVNAIVSSIPSRIQSDKDKAAFLLEYIYNHVEYSEEGNCHNAYGALMDGKAVCDGFASAYVCLLKKAGIKAMIVTGQFYLGGSHAWVALLIDGACYYVEPQASELYLSSREEMPNVLRKAYADLLPSTCNHHTPTTYYQHFMGSGEIVLDESVTIEQVANCFRAAYDSDTMYECLVSYPSGDLHKWVEENKSALLAELGQVDTLFCTLDYGYTEEGCYFTYIGEKSSTASIPVTKISLKHSDILFTSIYQQELLKPRFTPMAASPNVHYESSNPNVATVNEQGVVIPVSNGTATISITADGIRAQCSITVNLENHQHNTLRYVAAGEPSCFHNGNKAYYVCDGCNKWFYDQSATQPIQDLTEVSIPSPGHIYDSNWRQYSDCHIRQCNGTYCWQQEYGDHSDSNGDGICDICNYGAQSTTPTPKPTNPPTTPPTQQTSPSDTTDPSETTTPSNPTNPTDSTVPSVPTSQPTIPSDPTESTSSSDPLAPSVGSTLEASATPSGTTAAGNPEPGNDDHPNSTWIIYVALLLGIGGIISYLIYERKVKSS